MISDIQKTELETFVHGLSTEEKVFICSIIPSECVINAIANEMSRLNSLEKRVKDLQREVK